MDLTVSLMDLANKIAVECQKLKQIGIEKEDVPYIKYYVDFEYDGGTFKSFTVDVEEMTKKEFDPFKILELHKRIVIQVAPNEFHRSVNLLATFDDIDQSEAGMIIHKIIDRIAEKLLESSEYADDDLQGYISAICSSLERNLDWKVYMWINGIWTSKKSLKILDGAVLRQPLPSDFEKEIRKSFALSPIMDRGYEQGVNSILELDITESTEQQVSAEIINFRNLLILFRVGHLNFIQHTKIPSRIIGSSFGTTATRAYTHYPPPDYEFRTEDIKIFTQYATAIRPYLDKLTTQNNFIGIAYQRYHDAFRQHLNEGRVAFAINCLEALYLHKETGELSHRLCQRTAAILKTKSGYSGLQIYQYVKDAYKIRSKFVHGDTAKKCSRQLTDLVMNFARQSLLVFLQLGDRSKKGFLTLIDDSLLDEAKHQELLNMIQPMVIT